MDVSAETPRQVAVLPLRLEHAVETWITPLLVLMFTSGSTGRIVLPALSLIDRSGLVTMYWPFNISIIFVERLLKTLFEKRRPSVTW